MSAPNPLGDAEVAGARAMLDALVELRLLRIDQAREVLVPGTDLVALERLDRVLHYRMPAWPS